MSTILITGANGNLGRPVVDRLLKEHYKIISVSGKKGNRVVPSHERLENLTLDLMDEKKSSAFANSLIKREPGLKAAVLLVGGFAPGNMQDTDQSLIEKMIQLNFYTAFNLVKPLLARFSERVAGGRFVLIGARPPLKPAEGKNLVAYTLSKTLIFQLADIINAEGKGKDISATVVVPSVVDTQINRKAMPDADHTAWVPPEKIAEAIAFILSDAGSMLRNTVIRMYNRS